MDELIKSLEKCLANSFVMYFKTHSYHWNVEGINFSQYHSFFGDLYKDLHGAVDDIAEKLRIEDVYAPISLSDLYNDATLEEDKDKPASCRDMIVNAYQANTHVLECLNESFYLANQLNKQGLADFLAGRIDIHKKHEWMLRVSMKGL